MSAPRDDVRRTAVFVLAVLLTVAVLLTLDARHADRPTPLDPARRAAAAVFGPADAVAAGARTGSAGYLSALVRPGRADARIRALEAENARLSAGAAAARDRQAVATQLDALQRGAARSGVRVVAARVVAVGPAQGFERTVSLDAGGTAGIRPDTAVLTAAGLVGRVVAVTPGTTTVLLLCDTRSAVGVRVGSAGTVAVARGTGTCGRTLRVSTLAATAAPPVGTSVRTWGSEGGVPFPPALTVGRTAAVRGDTAVDLDVDLAADLTGLDVVGVVAS